MPVITIKEKEYSYNDGDIISFAEGLIGLPDMRRAVLISMNEFAPFCWLASLESESARFIVVDPNQIFSGYDPFVAAGTNNLGLEALAIVKVSSDWQKTTVNLRAPILIDPATKTASQQILSDSQYQFAESLPQN